MQEILHCTGLFGQGNANTEGFVPGLDNPNSFMRAGVLRLLQAAFVTVHSILLSDSELEQGQGQGMGVVALKGYAQWCYGQLVSAWQIVMNAFGRSIIHRVLIS